MKVWECWWWWDSGAVGVLVQKSWKLRVIKSREGLVWVELEKDDGKRSLCKSRRSEGRRGSFKLQLDVVRYEEKDFVMLDWEQRNI